MGDDGTRAPLLLHSLAEFGEIIFPVLDLAGARSVVEVGCEAAIFTRRLAGWAEQRHAVVRCVEPHPSADLVALCEASPALELVREYSPAALDLGPPADAYFLDGDHNYHTVLHELRAIDRGAGDGGTPSIAFLHDVAWPAGRRDLYYEPARLPAEAVHPFTFDKGVTPDYAGIVRGGFRGEGEFACAVEEGGAANGVLTAVEEFLADRDDLAYVQIPCVFGLGIVFSRSAPYADAVGSFLERYDASPLLERLEQNRLALYLRVIELQDALARLPADLEDALLRLRDVATENRALWARSAELQAEVDQLRAALGHETARREDVERQLEQILGSRSFAVASSLGGIVRGVRAARR